MALYEYAFQTRGGQDVRVERRYPMGEAPAMIVVDHEGRYYEATRVISMPGLKKQDLASWATDLPPENSPIIE